ncbi:hypothetical protein [Acidovorax lacteus]|uniref:LPD3 domain-containing protein n=1 Tax=Acidovorax lacteus TaxID=1924988 RepID=UPI0031EFC9A2
MTNHVSGIVARVSRNALDKMLSSKAAGQSEPPVAHAAAVANLDALFESAVLGRSKPDRDGNPNIRAIHRFSAPLNVNGQVMLAKMTVKETVRADQPNPLYTVESVEFNEKSPAAQWVDSTVQADELDPTSIRSAGDLRSLAQRVQDFNTVTLEDGQKKTPVASPRDTPIAGERATSANTGVSDLVRCPLQRVNPDSVSKVVDPQTGEPLCVYPGSTDFDAIANGVLPSNARSDTGNVRNGRLERGTGQDLESEDGRVNHSRQADGEVAAAREGTASVPGDPREGFDSLGPTQIAPTPTRNDLGAGTALIVRDTDIAGNPQRCPAGSSPNLRFAGHPVNRYEI